jgi:thiol-disulfide isomerase/thioredoxin
MRACVVLLAALSVAVLAGAASAASRFKDRTFAELESSSKPELVVFLHSSAPQARSVMQMLERVAERLSATTPQVGFSKCDGDSPSNTEKFRSAGFDKNLHYIFTVTPETGIERYSHTEDEDTLVRHVQNLFLPANERDVQVFTDEDDLYERLDSSEKPVMIKFFEQWCTHCKHLKPTFNRAASLYKDQVDFLEVECSKNQESKDFCAKHGVASYPVLKLITSSDAHKYDGVRSIIGMEEFFSDKLAGKFRRTASATAASSKSDAADDGSDDDDEDRKKKKKKKSKRSKRAKDEEQDSDDSAAATQSSKKSEVDEAPSKKDKDSAQTAGNADALEKRVAQLEKFVAELRAALKGVVGGEAGSSKSLRNRDDL